MVRFIWIIIFVILGDIGYTKCNESAKMRHKLIDSVFFENHNDIRVSLRNWRFVFDYNINDLLLGVETLINRLEKYIETAQSTPMLVDERTGSNEIILFYNEMLATQEIDLYEMKQKFHAINTEIQDIQSVLQSGNQKRRKRSILPIASGLLEFLVGVPSEKSFRKIEARIANIESFNEKYSHILQDSVTLLNISHIQISENRDRLYELSNQNDILFEQLHNVTEHFDSIISPMSQFISHFTQNTETLGRLRAYYADIKAELTIKIEQIDSLSRGELSMTLIPPEHLRDILLSIGKEIPSHLKLPHNPRGDELLHFYSYIKCALFRRNKHLKCICSLPLTDSQNIFKVYSAKSLVTEFNNNDVSLIGKYVLDHEYFCISEDKTKFIYLDQQTFSECSHSNVDFCNFKAAIYGIRAADSSCVIQLFLNGHNKNDLCPLSISGKTLNAPTIVNIHDNYWAILSNKDIEFTRYCGTDDIAYFKTKSPIDIISLESECHAVSSICFIPSLFEGKTDFDLPSKNWNVSIQQNIWKPTINKLKLEKPAQLKALQKITQKWTQLDDLQHKLLQNPPTNPLSFTSIETLDWLYIVILVMIVVLIVELMRYFIFAKLFDMIKKRFLQTSDLVIRTENNMISRVPSKHSLKSNPDYEHVTVKDIDTQNSDNEDK